MTVIELHNAAMNLADEADAQKRAENIVRAQELYSNAFESERKAAMLAIQESVDDMTTSILLKSAACLAYDAGMFRECEQVICYALSLENIPIDIAEELRNLYEDVNFYRHLRLANGVVLNDNEIQLSVAGRGVGYGIAREEDVIQRIQTFKQMSLRTIERKMGRAFRKKGSPAKDVQSLCSTYCSVPRAASFAINLRLGQNLQTTIPNLQSAATVLIDELMDDVELANSGEIDKLSEKIQDASYLQNFVNLAKELAPDGDEVNQVGFTCVRDGEVRSIGLTRKKEEFEGLVERAAELATAETINIITQPEKLSIEGLLMAANSDENAVKIASGKNKPKIIVPDGLSDIVRKYFGEQVRATVSKQNNIYTLISIDTIKTIQ